jgi:hypothetical protein
MQTLDTLHAFNERVWLTGGKAGIVALAGQRTLHEQTGTHDGFSGRTVDGAHLLLAG